MYIPTSHKMKTRRQNRFKKRTAKILMRGGTITKIKYKNRDYYHGEVNARGEKHGRGRMVENDGIVLVGEWKNDKMNGKGKMIYPSGAVYEGDFKDDLFHGHGVYNAPTKFGRIAYEGEFANHKRDGMGVLTTTNARGHGTMSGEFKDDVSVKCNGKLCRGRDIIEEGDFENDKLIRGKITWPDGGVSVGTYNKEGEQDGVGTYVGRGFEYHGEYQNGKLNGVGMLTYPSGAVYDGQFKNDKRNGIGRLTLPDGTTSIGRYENDNLLRPENFSQQSIYNRELGPAGRDFSIFHMRNK